LSDEPEAIAVIIRLAAELEGLGIDYMIGGSIASSVHGRPRTTDDIDVVARIAGHQVSSLVAALEEDFYVDAEMIRDAIRRRASFNLIHLQTMLKVDVFVFTGEELANEEMRRRLQVPLRDAKVWFSSPEDIILEKLEWYRKGEGVSERQWRDVLGVLAVQGIRLDLEYVRRWADRLALRDLLDRALAEVPKDE
jgi:hypothetical protein